MIPLRPIVGALAGGLLILPISAKADGLVTLCGADDQVGPVAGPVAPLNLRDAILGGGLVTFRCPDNTVIRVTHVHAVNHALTIDGGNKVTLDAGNVTGMLESDGGRYAIGLQNLKIRNARKPDDSPGSLPLVSPTSGVLGNAWSTTLDNVLIEGSTNPIEATYVLATGSRFQGNRGVILRGETITVRDSNFQDNDGLPISNSTRPLLINNRPFGRVPISGTLEITATQFQNNNHVDWTGKLYVAGSGFTRNGRGAHAGGAISADGNTTIVKTLFAENSAVNGGAIIVTSGGLSLRRVVFERNQASNDGGAIYADNSGDQPIAVEVSATTFRSNTAARGGAILLEAASHGPLSLNGQAVTFATNTATAEGGAVHAASGAVSLIRVVLVGNQAGSLGSAVFASGPNTAPSLFANALVTRNKAGSGFGVVVGAARFINVTLADNAGGLLIQPTKLRDGSSGRVALVNTVLTGNASRNCEAAVGATLPQDGGSNMQFPGATCGTLTVADPQLDSFGVPAPGSPVLNTGNDGVCVAAPISRRDLFGHHRPLAQHCTIGAVEGDLEREALQALRGAREIPAALEPLWRVLNPPARTIPAGAGHPGSTGGTSNPTTTGSPEASTNPR